MGSTRSRGLNSLMGESGARGEKKGRCFVKRADSGELGERRMVWLSLLLL